MTLALESNMGRNRAAERPSPERRRAQQMAKRERSIILRYVTCFCPHWSMDDREDIAQSVLLRVLEQRARNGPLREYSAGYLRAATRSEVIDQVRRKERRRETAIGSADDIGGWNIQYGEDPNSLERVVACRRVCEALLRRMTRMRTETRVALGLYMLGHSASQAAEILRCDRKRIENLVYRETAHIRRWFRNDMPFKITKKISRRRG